MTKPTLTVVQFLGLVEKYKGDFQAIARGEGKSRPWVYMYIRKFSFKPDVLKKIYGYKHKDRWGDEVDKN